MTLSIKNTSAGVRISRRTFTLGLTAVGLAGCATNNAAIVGNDGSPLQSMASIYGPLPDERFPIPAVDLDQLQPEYYRQEVEYLSDEVPGTVVVDTGSKFLFLVGSGGQAMRYGIGIGRQGFSWAGRATIDRKKEWPTWTPPAEMIEREPELARYANGMAPGLENPLGARALYLFQNGQDTLYRIHGTNEINSIGNAVSSGCIRLINQDIIDLFDRIQLGAEVVVQGHEGQTVHSHVV